MVECIDNNILHFPQLKAACNYQDDIFPHVFVGNERFATKPSMLRPYSLYNAFD